MTDDSLPPEQPSEPLELDRREAPAPAPSAPRVRSAARANPTAPEPKKKLSRENLQEGAIDTLLNSLSILGEVIEDFKSSDRFFKYKALVLVLWLSMTVGAFGVACPQSGPTNDISAHLIVSADGNVYMVKNESAEVWQDVEITVNSTWRSTATKIDPNGSVTLSPAVIFDGKGNRAPPSLKITSIEVRVLEPEATVVLLSNGVPQ